jgi:hypothetical protein
MKLRVKTGVDVCIPRSGTRDRAARRYDVGSSTDFRDSDFDSTRILRGQRGLVVSFMHW